MSAQGKTFTPPPWVPEEVIAKPRLITPFQGLVFLYPIVGLSPYANDNKAFSLYLCAF